MLSCKKILQKYYHKKLILPCEISIKKLKVHFIEKIVMATNESGLGPHVKLKTVRQQTWAHVK